MHRNHFSIVFQDVLVWLSFLIWSPLLFCSVYPVCHNFQSLFLYPFPSKWQPVRSHITDSCLQCRRNFTCQSVVLVCPSLLFFLLSHAFSSLALSYWKSNLSLILWCPHCPSLKKKKNFPRTSIWNPFATTETVFGSVEQRHGEQKKMKKKKKTRR